MIYFEISGPMTLNPNHYRSKPAWTILDQNLLAAIGAGGNCLFTAWTFVPAIAFKLPGKPWLSRIVTSLLPHTAFLVSLVDRAPPGILHFHLPMLPHSRAIALATGMKMDFGSGRHLKKQPKIMVSTQLMFIAAMK